MQAGNLSHIGTALTGMRESSPVIIGEIGDTWIYDAPSDPLNASLQ